MMKTATKPQLRNPQEYAPLNDAMKARQGWLDRETALNTELRTAASATQAQADAAGLPDNPDAPIISRRGPDTIKNDIAVVHAKVAELDTRISELRKQADRAVRMTFAPERAEILARMVDRLTALKDSIDEFREFRIQLESVGVSADAHPYMAAPLNVYSMTTEDITKEFQAWIDEHAKHGFMAA